MNFPLRNQCSLLMRKSGLAALLRLPATRLSAALFSHLLISACLSNIRAENYSGRFTPQTRRFGNFRKDSVTTAPLQIFFFRFAPLPCKQVFANLLLKPETTLNAKFVTWNHVMSSNGSETLGPGSLRSYLFESLRITEKIRSISPGNFFAYSYVSNLHDNLWPFDNHLAIVTTEPESNGCLVTFRHFYALPWGIEPLIAETRLVENLTLRTLNEVAKGRFPPTTE